MNKLYQDYIGLVKRFPSCSLANKYDSFKCIFERRNNKSKIKDIDKAILDVLRGKRLTTKQIAHKLGFAIGTIQTHFRNLHKNLVINKFYLGKGFKWYYQD